MKWPLEAPKPAEGNAVAIDCPLFSIWQECMVKDTRYLTFYVGTQAESPTFVVIIHSIGRNDEIC